MGMGQHQVGGSEAVGTESADGVGWEGAEMDKRLPNFPQQWDPSPKGTISHSAKLF